MTASPRVDKPLLVNELKLNVALPTKEVVVSVPAKPASFYDGLTTQTRAYAAASSPTPANIRAC